MAAIDLKEVDRLSKRALDALLDAEAREYFGSEQGAIDNILMALGLSEGDAVAMASPTQVELQTPLPTILARLDRAGQLKRTGWPTSRIVMQGLS